MRYRTRTGTSEHTNVKIHRNITVDTRTYIYIYILSLGNGLPSISNKSGKYNLISGFLVPLRLRARSRVEYDADRVYGDTTSREELFLATPARHHSQEASPQH